MYPGDSVSINTNNYTGNFATANPGNNINVNVSFIGLSGGAANNYTLTPPTGLTADITGTGPTPPTPPIPPIPTPPLTPTQVATAVPYPLVFSNFINGTNSNTVQVNSQASDTGSGKGGELYDYITGKGPTLAKPQQLPGECLNVDPRITLCDRP